MKAELVLVEREDKETNELLGCSGILFNEKYVLITSNVLAPLLQNDQTKPSLDELTPGVLHFNTFKSIRLNVVTKNKVNSDLFNFKNATILGAFLCTNIQKSCTILKDFAVDHRSNQNNLMNILSSFFILSVENRGTPADLKLSLEKWFRSILNEDLQKGDEIFSDSVPFGNRHFLNTYTRGIVSNIIGANDCIVLSDCPSTPGCEGSPIYNLQKSQHSLPVGITVSSLSWWRGEWIGLTLFADIRPLLLQLLEPDSIPYTNREIAVNTSLHFKLIGTIELGLAQVYCGTSSWGTAMLIDKSKGIFITNSHVVDSVGKIYVYWKQKSARCKCVYKTLESSVYDIAIIQIEDGNNEMLKQMKPIAFFCKVPTIGDMVYSAGFPIFPKDLNLSPTISKGQISQYSTFLLKTTCFVHAGSSGGAILTPEGSLVGIIVCNIKMKDTGTIYPRCNMAVPILDISTIIKQFLITNDEHILNKLNLDGDPSKLCLQAKL